MRKKHKKLIISLMFLIYSLSPIEMYANNIGIEFQGYLKNNLISINDINSEHNLSFNNIDLYDIKKIGQAGQLITGWEKRYYLSIYDLPIELGYIQKYERDVYINEDIIKFLYDREKNNMQKDNYSLYLVNWDQLVEGIFLGGQIYKNDKYGLSVDLYGKLFNGVELNRSYYNCNIKMGKDGGIITGVRHSMYSSYSKNDFYDANFSSKGYSFDCQIYWEIDSSMNLTLSMRDVYSKMYWHDVYSLLGGYNTDNINVDLDGYLYYEPIFHGNYYLVDSETSFTPEINLKYQNKRLELGFISKNEVSSYINYLVFDKSLFTEELKIRLGILQNNYTTSLSYSGLDIDLVFDELKLLSSKNLIISIGGNFSF